jgi:hypothetical protein
MGRSCSTVALNDLEDGILAESEPMTDIAVRLIEPSAQITPETDLFLWQSLTLFKVYFNWDSRVIREGFRCRDANC